MNKAVGEKLRELRKTRGMELENILHELNISESTYFRMEKGETASWTSKIDQICKLYKIEPEELLLSKEKYVIISNFETNNGNGTINGNVSYNIPDKVSELYEGIIKQKDEIIRQKDEIIELLKSKL